MANLPPLSPVDYASFAVILVSVVMGIRSGIAGQLVRALSLVAALAASLAFHRPAGDWFHQHTALDEPACRVAGFALTIGAAIALVMTIRLLWEHLSPEGKEKKADRIAGALAGLVRGVVLVLIVFVLMNLWPNAYLNDKFGVESAIGNVVLMGMPSLRSKLHDLPLIGNRGGGKTGKGTPGGIRGVTRDKARDLKELTK